jgi:hypothetical protein
MREAFEAWMRDSTPLKHPVWRARTETGEYQAPIVQADWRTWQAATAAEREQCAKVCDAIGEWHAKTDMKLAYVADKCAEIIRAAAIRNRKEPA